MARQKADKQEYGENKERINISLAPTAQKLLDEQGAILSISRSELIERFARGLIGSKPEVRVLGEFCANRSENLSVSWQKLVSSLLNLNKNASD